MPRGSCLSRRGVARAAWPSPHHLVCVEKCTLPYPPHAQDAGDVTDGLHARNQTAFQSALDNVRNLVGSPLAGIDDQEMVDTRHLCTVLSDLISLDPETGAHLFGGPGASLCGTLVDAARPLFCV